MAMARTTEEDTTTNNIIHIHNHNSHPSTSSSKFSPIPATFTARKSRILASLSTPTDIYTDKSPKGSIDAPIVGFIDEINRIEGLVTTSSCSGRVAVFVEGRKRATGPINDRDGSESRSGSKEDEAEIDDGGERETIMATATATSKATMTTRTSPAGKGGGRWLYVSHNPVEIPSTLPMDYFTKLCGLTNLAETPPSTHSPTTSNTNSPSDTIPASNGQLLPSAPPPRLIKLIFSPLILHIQCATLAHARPLLTAAVNAGFRESGVQSLKVLEDPESGVTVGIRTNGIAFESVVGFAMEETDEAEEEEEDNIGNNKIVGGEEKETEKGEVYQSVVGEEYLKIMFGIVNERFEWNERRKERLRGEIERCFGMDASGEGGDASAAVWEEKEARRERKRKEGLIRQKELKKETGYQISSAGGIEQHKTVTRQMDGTNGKEDFNLDLVSLMESVS